MNYEEAVEPQEAEPIEQMIDQAEADQGAHEDNDQVERAEKTMVPLSALQKVREKKRELELELQWERQRNAQQMQPQKAPEDDSSRYESATREDLNRAQQESMRLIEEKLWVKQNPEKYELINEQLPTFLKQRPNLLSAINDSGNRYEEAYTLMTALSPKQQTQLRKDTAPVVKKQAPNAPGGVPKAAALNDAVDIMGMSDAEFSEWRKSKKSRR